jgi:hypothetical protein
VNEHSCEADCYWSRAPGLSDFTQDKCLCTHHCFVDEAWLVCVCVCVCVCVGRSPCTLSQMGSATPPWSAPVSPGWLDTLRLLLYGGVSVYIKMCISAQRELCRCVCVSAPGPDIDWCSSVTVLCLVDESSVVVRHLILHPSSA